MVCISLAVWLGESYCISLSLLFLQFPYLQKKDNNTYQVLYKVCRGFYLTCGQLSTKIATGVGVGQPLQLHDIPPFWNIFASPLPVEVSSNAIRGLSEHPGQLYFSGILTHLLSVPLARVFSYSVYSFSFEKMSASLSSSTRHKSMRLVNTFLYPCPHSLTGEPE